LQILSAAFMGFSHGQNDAQKTMGIITLALVAATQSGTIDHAPSWLAFLHTSAADGSAPGVPTWVKIVCALTMAAGTAAGGWRIIRTMGHKMVKLQPVHGFAAETAAASVLSVAAHLGMPVSTTHAITSSIMGVGTARSTRAINIPVVQRILFAWLLTLPITAILGFLLEKLLASTILP
jgi:PiT family inorganic phosphate transporter